MAEQGTELTAGGAYVSIDALGDAETTTPAVLSPGPRPAPAARHVEQEARRNHSDAVDVFVFRDLQFIGSFGMQAARYPECCAWSNDHQARSALPAP